MKLRVTNLDYTKVLAEPVLSEALTRQVQETVAADAGDGVMPKDVVVTLNGGASEIDVLVKLNNPSDDAVALTIAHLKDEAVPGDVAAAVSDVDEISAVSMGAIGAEMIGVPHKAEFFAAASMAGPAPAPAGAGDTGADTCYPECVPGRGVCNDRICYCRSPYHGMSCERKFKAVARVRYEAAAGIVLVALILGILAGSGVFALTNSSWQNKYTAPEPKKEKSGEPEIPSTHIHGMQSREVWKVKKGGK